MNTVLHEPLIFYVLKKKTAPLVELQPTTADSSGLATTRGVVSWQSQTPSSLPCNNLPISGVNNKDDTNDSIGDDEYVNDTRMIVKNPLAKPLPTTSPPMMVRKTSREDSKRVIDFGDDDFAFVDPKVIVTKIVHSRSANNLKKFTQPSVKMTGTVGQNLIVQSALPHSRSTGDLNRDTTGGTEYEYNYVASEVDWALGKHHTPGGARLSSSDEDSVNEPLYENELSMGESIYENEVRLASYK